ncbi:MAG: hypothetical protein K2G83_00670, partial [Ruminococcus sp.]|nr:hypothetical protein [Ruminococcus sp.]
MNCNKRDKLKYIPAIILLICLITIIMGCIRFNHIVQSRNTVLNIEFNNTSGFVCCIQDNIFYSDSKGIGSLQDKSYYEDIKSQCLLFENEDTVYAYEIESGNLFQLNDNNTSETLYQIDKGMNEVYAFNNILFAIKYHSDKSYMTFKIYNLKDGLEINLSEFDSLSYKFTESNKFSIDVFLIDDLAIILDNMKNTRFLE